MVFIITIVEMIIIILGLFGFIRDKEDEVCVLGGGGWYVCMGGV